MIISSWSNWSLQYDSIVTCITENASFVGSDVRCINSYCTSTFTMFRRRQGIPPKSRGWHQTISTKRKKILLYDRLFVLQDESEKVRIRLLRSLSDSFLSFEIHSQVQGSKKYPSTSKRCESFSSTCQDYEFSVVDLATCNFITETFRLPSMTFDVTGDVNESVLILHLCDLCLSFDQRRSSISQKILFHPRRNTSLYLLLAAVKSIIDRSRVTLSSLV